MYLEVNISKTTADWLKQKANQAGTDQASVAASLLDQLAAQEQEANGHTPDDRLQFFRRWLATLPPRPGPPVGTSRDSIYG